MLDHRHGQIRGFSPEDLRELLADTIAIRDGKIRGVAGYPETHRERLKIDVFIKKLKSKINKANKK